MKAIIDYQIASESAGLPERKQIETWVSAALEQDAKNEVTVRVVDEEESQTLNFDYRHKNKPTNVLSFGFEAPPEVPVNILGDLVICAPVVAREAKEQNKPLEAHWAHMVVHGTLHLQGYDHEEKEQAELMETLEVSLLKSLGYPNPY